MKGITNIHLPVEPTRQVPDKLQYYLGNRVPVEDDPWFEELETQPDSLVFHGELYGEATTVRIIGRSPRLTPEIDSFNAQVPVILADGEIRTITGQFTETEPDTNTFRCEIRIPGVPGGGAGRERWVVRDIRREPAGATGTYAPFTMRVKGLPDPDKYTGAWDEFPAEFTESQLAPNDGWLYLKGGSVKIASITIRDSDKVSWLISYDEETHMITNTVKDYITLAKEKVVGRVANQDAEVAAKVVFPLGPKIITPRLKQDLIGDEKLSAIFSTTAPYCYENQSVVLLVPGSNKGIKSILGIKSIIGDIPSYIKYEWKLTEQAGSLEDHETLRPLHIPPDFLPPPADGGPYAPLDVFIGLLELKVMHSPLKDLKAVQVFKDHLARDAANFRHGKKCADSVGGIQLADGSQVKEVSLTCGPSMTHAHKGKTSPVGMAFWNELKAEGWTENSYSWADFQTLPLERGWKLWLGETDMGKYHPSTVLEDKTGAQALTYAGDGETDIFRHEKVEDYYTMLEIKYKRKIPPDRRIVWVLNR